MRVLGRTPLETFFLSYAQNDNHQAAVVNLVGNQKLPDLPQVETFAAFFDDLRPFGFGIRAQLLDRTEKHFASSLWSACKSAIAFVRYSMT